jgi:UDP-N-acetylmuramoylalanine--D-glutamate ligase
MQNPAGKRVLVVGLARTGRAAAEFFHRRGAVVTVSDARPPWTFVRDTPQLLAQKMGVEFGQHGVETFLRQDLIVVSPGVPWDLPALTAARERGIPVEAEVEAASWFLKGRLVGVTGSNGKTTTTTLIGRLLEVSGYSTFVGGNIGVPMISMVEQANGDSVSVAELSSFQLEGTEYLHPHVAVILNITPNHLDRHHSFEAYLEAKARILRNQTEDDYAVLNADDPAAAGLAERTRAQKVFFSRTRQLPDGLVVSGGQVVYRIQHLERDLFSARDVKLRGGFNLENVLAASATACVLGAGFEAMAQAVRDFRGVEHRLELVSEVSGIEFYNDSKATSVDATAKALEAFERGVHLILGGKDKGAPYAPLIPLLKNRVREVLVIGAASKRIAEELSGSVELEEVGDLETATRTAFSRARPSEVVLLSPACSSYDQFQDFEERGRRFKALVGELAREASAERTRLPPFELKPSVVAVKAPPRTVLTTQDAVEMPGNATAKGSTVTLAVTPDPVAGTAQQPSALSSAAAEATGHVKAREKTDTKADSEDGKNPGPPGETAATFAEKIETPVKERAQANTGHPERIYVYELDAEVRPPLDSDAEFSIDDIVLDRLPQPSAARSAHRAIDNEPLIFEVTPAGPPGNPPKDGVAAPPGARRISGKMD